jgi:hypothetical protein
MTEEQWPICSGVFARPILHAATFSEDMTFHRSHRAEIKGSIVTKSWSPAPICRNVFPL